MSETPDDAWDHIGTLSAEITRLRAALAGAIEVVEHIHNSENDGDCRWDDGSEKHCPGTCDAIGCLRIRIQAAADTSSPPEAP